MKSYIIYCLLIIFGVSYSQKQRIFGGDVVTDSEYNFVVSIQYAGKHICAGSILNDTAGKLTSYVVTAAHCIAGLDKDSLTVRHSSPRLYMTKRAYVEEGFVHSGYQKGSYMYDIGVLRIVDSFPDTARGILPNKDEIQDGPNNNGDILGWGAQSGTNNVLATTLKKSTVNYVPYEKCSETYPNIVSHMICTNQGQSAACYGDDGGPFVTTDKKKLVGIISWGSSCNSPTRPKVLIRVADFQTWLQPFLAAPAQETEAPTETIIEVNQQGSS